VNSNWSQLGVDAETNILLVSSPTVECCSAVCASRLLGKLHLDVEATWVFPALRISRVLWFDSSNHRNAYNLE